MRLGFTSVVLYVDPLLYVLCLSFLVSSDPPPFLDRGPVTGSFSGKALLRRGRTKCSTFGRNVSIGIRLGCLHSLVRLIMSAARGRQGPRHHDHSVCVVPTPSLRSLSLGTAHRVVSPIDCHGTLA